MWFYKGSFFLVFDILCDLRDKMLDLLFVDVNFVIIFVSLDKEDKVEFVLFVIFILCGSDMYFVLDLWF